MNERKDEVSSDRTNILELPLDVLIEIFTHVNSFEMFLNLGLTCKNFYTLSKLNIFWRRILPEIQDELEQYVNRKINNYQFFKRIKLSYNDNIAQCRDIEDTVYQQYLNLLKNCDRVSKLVRSEVRRRKKDELFNTRFKTKLLWKVLTQTSFFIMLLLLEILLVFFGLESTNTRHKTIYKVVNFTTIVMVFFIVVFMQGFEIIINRKYPFPLSRLDIKSLISRKERRKVQRFIVEMEDHRLIEKKKRKRHRRIPSIHLQWKKRWKKNIQVKLNPHYASLFEICSPPGDSGGSSPVSINTSPLGLRPASPLSDGSTPNSPSVISKNENASLVERINSRERLDSPTITITPPVIDAKNFRVFHLESSKKGGGNIMGSDMTPHQYIWETEWIREKNESVLCSILCYFNWVFYLAFFYGVKIFFDSEYMLWIIVGLPALFYILGYTLCLFWVIQKSVTEKCSKFVILMSLATLSTSICLLIILVSLKLDFGFFYWGVCLICPVSLILLSFVMVPFYFLFKYCVLTRFGNRISAAMKEKNVLYLITMLSVVFVSLFIEIFIVLFSLVLDEVIAINVFWTFIPLFCLLLLFHSCSCYFLCYSIRLYVDKSTEDFIQSL